MPPHGYDWHQPANGKGTADYTHERLPVAANPGIRTIGSARHNYAVADSALQKQQRVVLDDWSSAMERFLGRMETSLVHVAIQQAPDPLKVRI